MEAEKERKFHVRGGKAVISLTCPVEMVELLDKVADAVGKDRTEIINYLLDYALKKFREEAEAEKK